MQLAPGLAVNVLFERRVGVGRAAIADPVRALPFLQTEGDYWSAGAGLELLPQVPWAAASSKKPRWLAASTQQNRATLR